MLCSPIRRSADMAHLSPNGLFDAPLGEHDDDPQETAEWLDALDSVAREAGAERAQFLFDRLAAFALTRGVKTGRTRITPYQNTISVEQQPAYPGNLELEEKLSAAIRWNALAMVVRANRAYGELGGHIASYASAADLFEVGFNHFFRADSSDSKATWCSSSRTRPPVSMPGPFWRASSTKNTWSTTGRKST